MSAAASVHRFRDLVAVRTGTGETVYLTPKAARQLARALNGAARSITGLKFSESHFGTVTIFDGDDWHLSGRDYREARK